ncbi:hypothetical protein [Euzebya sp.]|uniref:hypothetical protein n=1 Tax=Euzebya sp. TaxID=1971409 RepID=UPI00351663CA
MIFRRKQLPEELRPAHDAFAAQVDRLEQARSALMSCLPVGRVDPAPVPVGLDLLADELDAIAAEMDAWQVPELAEEWRDCVDAIAEAKSKMPTAHEVAETSTELEELLGAVEDVDEPLGHAFGRAERRWRDLRR